MSPNRWPQYGVETSLIGQEMESTEVINQLLEGLTPEQLCIANQIGRKIKFATGEVLFREHDPGDCMFLVLSGSVAIGKVAPNGQMQRLGIIEAGSYLGEMSLIDSEPRSAQAIAWTPAVVQAIDKTDLRHLVQINSHILLNLLKGVSQRLRSMNTKFLDQIVHQEKMSLVGQMAGSIIHDFKNPMSVICGQAELLMRDEKNASRCQSIIRNADHILIMANDILDFAKGQVKLNRRAVSAELWLKDLRELLQPMIDATQTDFRCNVRLADSIWIDPDRMTRVLYNLAVNAMQAMPRHGTLTIRLEQIEENIVVELSDTGPGIPESIRDKLFEPFVTYDKKNGTGLGTSIAKRIVEEHGGTISFTSVTGRGTTFQIRLPVPVPHPLETLTV